MTDEIKKAGANEGAEEGPTIDAKLLADAVIALNISKRNVSLYPVDHPITRGAIEKAFDILNKLFELRSSITLGVAKDMLMIDNYVLDRKNPVFREFAEGLHNKGIAALTFLSGLSLEELLHLHEIIVSRDGPTGQAAAELADKKGIRSIRLTPLDLSKFGFIQDKTREDGTDEVKWEDYIYGLVEGKLTGDDAENAALSVPPEALALYFNKNRNKAADTDDGKIDNPGNKQRTDSEAYDKVITTYLTRKEHAGIRADLFSRFVTFVENLSPDLKKQFLSRTFSRTSIDAAEIEQVMMQMTSPDIDRTMKLFSEQSTMIPESVRNLLEKLKYAKASKDGFDTVAGKKVIIDDIELNENIQTLFNEDRFTAFVSEDYKKELARMLGTKGARDIALTEDLKNQFEDGVIDSRFSELALELLDSASITLENYVGLLTTILGGVNNFLESGRFREVTGIYNTIHAQTINGRFKEEAARMLDLAFHSDEFIETFVQAIRIWGRHNREEAVRLANLQRDHVLEPLLDSLSEETNPSVRGFILQLLVSLGRGTMTAAVKRLNDPNWYVVRNMIYLIREGGGAQYVSQVRKLAKHVNKKVCIEAVRTLLQFGTPDSSSYIKFYLRSDDAELREQAVRLSGLYQCRDAVPELTELLRKKNVFGPESAIKLAVIKALGEIGDPAVVDDLIRICKSRTLLYRSALEVLKAEIFRSLEQYPPGPISRLLDLGLKSKNDEIRAISKKILSGGAIDVQRKNI